MSRFALSLLLLLATAATLVVGVDVRATRRARHGGDGGAASVFSATSDPSLVTTSLGTLRGNVTSTFRVFASVPYAQPPVGELRFAASRAALPWHGVRDATRNGAACPQLCDLPPHTCPTVEDEDCLFVKVYTPLPSSPSRPAAGWPVMVWLHGGNFRQGSAENPLYAGDVYATKGIVTVLVNYRLGFLGWLLNSQLPSNQAFYDQRLALQFVAEHIAAFGGDPTRVTLFGQSAGATSVAAHLTSPLAPAFTAAISESNPSGLYFKTQAEMAHLCKNVAKAVDCDVDDLVCLRNVSTSRLLQAQHDEEHKIPIVRPLQLFYPWVPTIDGVSVVGQPVQQYQRGAFHSMPLVLGTVFQECVIFVYQAFTEPLSRLLYDALIVGLFNLHAPGVLRQYPCNKTMAADCRPVMAQLATDLLFRCPNRNMTENAVARSNGAPTFLYMYDHVASVDFWGPTYPHCADAVCHGAELPFVFGNGAPFFNFTPAEQRMSSLMVDYWSNFAKTHDPNSPGDGSPAPDVTWTEYDVLSRPSVRLTTAGSGSHMENQLDELTCDIWDERGYFYW